MVPIDFLLEGSKVKVSVTLEYLLAPNANGQGIPVIDFNVQSSKFEAILTWKCISPANEWRKFVPREFKLVIRNIIYPTNGPWILVIECNVKGQCHYDLLKIIMANDQCLCAHEAKTSFMKSSWLLVDPDLFCYPKVKGRG